MVGDASGRNRYGNIMKRTRARGHPRRQQNSVNRSYDSNGPEVRVRGTAFQLHEKYTTLARDAMVSGDRVVAENYQQHAEHYYRVLQGISPTIPVAAVDNGDETGASSTPMADSQNGVANNGNDNGRGNAADDVGVPPAPNAPNAPNANRVAAAAERPMPKPRRQTRLRGPLATNESAAETAPQPSALPSE